MLSGTASWLNLAVYEFLGVDVRADELRLAPVLPAGLERMAYTLRLADGTIRVEIEDENGRSRAGKGSVYTLDGAPAGPVIPRPTDGKEHRVKIQL